MLGRRAVGQNLGECVDAGAAGISDVHKAAGENKARIQAVAIDRVAGTDGRDIGLRS